MLVQIEMSVTVNVEPEHEEHAAAYPFAYANALASHLQAVLDQHRKNIGRGQLVLRLVPNSTEVTHEAGR